MVHGTRLYHSTPNMNQSILKTQVHHLEAKGDYIIGNFSHTRFPEMYITLEGTPFADCPALLVVIALLVIAACVALPLYVYRRKIYYKCVMVVYRRRKDKLARELKKRMKIHREDPTYPLQSGSLRRGSDMVTCLICMDPLLDAMTTDLVIVLDACGHRFHFKCILKWLDMSDGCPICRKTVDVNDRGALRLVYSDCRPDSLEGHENEEGEGEGAQDATKNAETSSCSGESEAQPTSIKVDINTPQTSIDLPEEDQEPDSSRPPLLRQAKQDCDSSPEGSTTSVHAPPGGKCDCQERGSKGMSRKSQCDEDMIEVCCEVVDEVEGGKQSKKGKGKKMVTAKVSIV